jgi:plasmid stabilization system protein ParE
MSSQAPRLRVFTEQTLRVCAPLAELAVDNACSPSRIENVARVLGVEFVPPGATVAPGLDPRVPHHNIASMRRLCAKLLPVLRERYQAGGEVSDEERRVYVRVVYYYLHDRYAPSFQEIIDRVAIGADKNARAAPFYAEFAEAYGQLLGFLGRAPDVVPCLRLFEILFQARRAFFALYTKIRGRSAPVARLRAAIWSAIFGGLLDDHGLHRWNRMHKLPVLIQGPTGTGKELSAQTIAASGYVPFDVAEGAFAPYDHYYAGINLVAFAPGVLPSELYGHVKGAFTGAVKDRVGILEGVPEFGAVLLDEIAEIPLEMQAELLRVLQERRFRAVGEEKESRRLAARVLCATHRDMALLMHEGRVREDFFRRVCMMKLRTPSLRERLDDLPDELRDLVAFIAADLFGPESAESLVDQVETVVRARLRRHPWTGNMRELAQCVAEVQTTGTYVPERPDPAVALALDLRQVKVPLEDVRRRYAEIAVAKAGNPTAAARLLDVDTRTLKALLKGEPAPARKRAPASSTRTPASSKRTPSSKRGPGSGRRS